MALRPRGAPPARRLHRHPLPAGAGRGRALGRLGPAGDRQPGVAQGAVRPPLVPHHPGDQPVHGGALEAVRPPRPALPGGEPGRAHLGRLAALPARPRPVPAGAGGAAREPAAPRQQQLLRDPVLAHRGQLPEPRGDALPGRPPGPGPGLPLPPALALDRPLLPLRPGGLLHLRAGHLPPRSGDALRRAGRARGGSGGRRHPARPGAPDPRGDRPVSPRHRPGAGEQALHRLPRLSGDVPPPRLGGAEIPDLPLRPRDRRPVQPAGG